MYNTYTMTPKQRQSSLSALPPRDVYINNIDCTTLMLQGEWSKEAGTQFFPLSSPSQIALLSVHP